MFLIETCACICAPEDRWTHIGPAFATFEDAIAYAEESNWVGDILSIRYNRCIIAYKDDYKMVIECPALANLEYQIEPALVELPF